MTLARENSEAAQPEPSTALAARLDLLVQRRITIDQFEADMVRGCEADAEQVWSLLALLDQYHRLEKLPTELYRALKAAADRYGLVRREPYIPHVPTAAGQPAEQESLATPGSRPAPAAVSAAAPMTATVDAPPSAMAPPATPAPQAAAVVESVAESVTSDAASDTPPETPFRHLIDNSPVTAAQPAIGDLQGTWQGSRYVRPTTPPRRSRQGRVALTVVLLMAMAAGAAVWLKQRQLSGDMSGDTGDAGATVPNSASAPPPPPAAATAPAPTATADAAPAPAPAAAPTVAPAAAPLPATPAASAPAPEPAAAPAATATAQAPPVATSRPASVELTADRYTVRPGDSAARILVRRSGELGGAVEFTWWTEDATAVAGTDYVAWGRRTGKIPAGRSSVTLLVPIINDSTRTAPRRFLVVIGPASKGGQPGTITRATVQLPGTD